MLALALAPTQPGACLVLLVLGEFTCCVTESTESSRVQSRWLDPNWDTTRHAAYWAWTLFYAPELGANYSQVPTCCICRYLRYGTAARGRFFRIPDLRMDGLYEQLSMSMPMQMPAIETDGSTTGEDKALVGMASHPIHLQPGTRPDFDG